MARLVLLSERLGPVTAVEQRLASEAGAMIKSAALWTTEQIIANAREAVVVILGVVEPFDRETIDRLPVLQAIVRRGVGTDNVDLAAASERGIVVANVPDASVEEVSDHALALLLTLERRIPMLDGAVHSGAWARDPTAIAAVRRDIRRLSELSLGIVGFGRIGQALARKARALYRDVLAFDPYAKPGVADGLGATLVDFDVLLRSSDHISLHLPATNETKNMIGRDELSRIRDGAILVNTARGH